MSIEEYLAELERRLRVGRLTKRRILQEIRAHLKDAAQEEEQRGVSGIEAERRAVDRLGSAEILAERFPRVPRPRVVAKAAIGVLLFAEATTALVLAVHGNPSHATPLAWSTTISAGSSGTWSTTVFANSSGLVHLTPTSSVIDGSSTSTITVQAVDANGNTLTSGRGGSTVTITKQSGTSTIGSVTDKGVTITATITGSGR